MNTDVSKLNYEQKQRIGELEDFRDSLPYTDGEPDPTLNKRIDEQIAKITQNKA